MSLVDAPSTVTAVLPESTRRLSQVARGAAFWSGIALAFAQVPLLAAGVTADSPLLLVGLLVVNLIAMVLGSGYRA